MQDSVESMNFDNLSTDQLNDIINKATNQNHKRKQIIEQIIKNILNNHNKNTKIYYEQSYNDVRLSLENPR